MKNENGSALIFVLITFSICIIFMVPVGNAILNYTTQKYSLLDDEQTYFTAVDAANLFADEICNQTTVGEKILNSLLAGNVLNFDNLTFDNCDRCDVGVEMPYRNKIIISSSATKNKSRFDLQLNLVLDELSSPSAWKIKKYAKAEVNE